MIARDTKLLQIRTGRVGPLGPKNIPSGIRKFPRDDRVAVGFHGLADDEQGDRKHHGGLEKAIHHYPLAHYAHWQAEIPERSALLTSGGFGENFVASGWTESDICIGDIVAVGSAVLQVSQARQPCFRLNLRFDLPDMARRTQASLRTGWYYRVLDPGRVAAGEDLRVIGRGNPTWPLSRLLQCLYVDCLDASSLVEIAGMKDLSASWRNIAQKRLEKASVENWSLRLEIPR